MTVRILVNHTLEEEIECSSPLAGIAQYVETRMPPEERLVFKGSAMSDRAMLRTRNYTIEARAVLAEVTA